MPMMPMPPGLMQRLQGMSRNPSFGGSIGPSEGFRFGNPYQGGGFRFGSPAMGGLAGMAGNMSGMMGGTARSSSSKMGGIGGIGGALGSIFGGGRKRRINPSVTSPAGELGASIGPSGGLPGFTGRLGKRQRRMAAEAARAQAAAPVVEG